jgi:ferredoxin--NADP+ reductase
VRPDEAQLDPVSQAQVDASEDRTLIKKIEILQGYAQRTPSGKPRSLHVRFRVSPVEVLGDAHGRVRGLRLVRNVLVPTDGGGVSAKPTGEFEDLDVGLVFRSVGYRGVPLPGVPFDERAAVIPNAAGRVMDPDSHAPIPGLYVSGWIKRGPSGVIGTNKPDSVETVMSMLADAAEGRHWRPPAADRDSAATLIAARQPFAVSYPDWRTLDALEVANGQALGRPRLKMTRVDEMLAALGRSVKLGSR